MDIVLLKTSIIPDSSATFTTTLVIAGFFGVLLFLSILIILVNLFSKAVAKTQKSKGKKKDEKPIMTEDLKIVSPFGKANIAPVTASSPVQAPQNSSGVSEEVVAAISAAVYMMEGENAVVKSITPIRQDPITRRNPWAMAAINENTKPF